MTEFREMQLDPRLLRGVEAAGYSSPFPIQAQAIGPLLKGRDLIGQAKTGSGKTAAFALPMLQAADPGSRVVQALVLAPTRELAVQIATETKKLGAYTGVRVLCVYGGQSINVQFEGLRRGAQVVVGTPGRLIDHIRRGSIELDRVRFLVLDEADTMLDMGFIDDVEFIMSQTPREKQVCLFSATMPGRIADLARRFMRDPVTVMIDSDEPSVETLDQFYAVVDQREKLAFLADLLQREKPSSAIIFCRTKYGAHRLARDLQRRGFGAIALHGNLSQHQRDHSMGTFRAGHAEILVATDVASRGIDVPRVACVVNYEVPEDPLLYFHRVGRTARAGRKGRSFTLVSGEESSDFARILRMTKAPITPLRPEDGARTFVVRSDRSRREGWRRHGRHRAHQGRRRDRRGRRYR